MRPDKRKRNRGRNYEKTDSAATPEKKVEEKNDSKLENVSNTQKETEKADVNKKDNIEEAVTKDKSETQPIPTLKRETDDLKETKKFSKRQIYSNWDKYDEPIVPEEEDEIHDDFAMLIQRNFSGDEHFKFKFQQQWESGSCNINQDLFTLNLERLSVGLSCIPYYKRLNVPTELFSEDELQRMQDKANANEKGYENLLKGEPAESVTASLIGKLKECLEDQIIDKTNINSNEQDVKASLFDIEEFVIEEKVTSEDDFWNVDQSENIRESQVIAEMVISAQVSDEKVLGSQWMKTKEKETHNIEMNVEATEETREELNVNRVEANEFEKGQRRKRPSNRRRESEKKSSDKVDGVLDSSTNIIKNDPPREKGFETNEYVAFRESAVKEDEPVKIPEVTVPPKARNSTSKNISKMEALGEDEETIDSLLSGKKSTVPPLAVNKKKIEDEDVLDSLLSLKEPSLPEFDLSRKVEDEEHDVERLVTNVSSIVIHEKKENLEEWLDSMLDD